MNNLLNEPLPDPTTTMNTWAPRKRKFTFPHPIMDTYPDGPRLPGAAEPEAAEPEAAEPDGKKRKAGKRTKRKRSKRRRSKRRL